MIGLAFRLGIPRDDAQQLIDAYFEGFQNVKDFCTAGSAWVPPRDARHVATITSAEPLHRDGS